MKTILISVTDREISVVRFNDVKIAQEKMKNELYDCTDLEEDKYEIEENGMSAWANIDDGDMHCDWEIVKIDEEMKYLYISVIDREIMTEQYKTLEEAKEKLKSNFDFYISLGCDDDYDDEYDEYESECECEISESGMSAWANADDGDVDCDWLIVEIDSEYIKAS